MTTMSMNRISFIVRGSVAGNASRELGTCGRSLGKIIHKLRGLDNSQPQNGRRNVSYCQLRTRRQKSLCARCARNGLAPRQTFPIMSCCDAVQSLLWVPKEIFVALRNVWHRCHNSSLCQNVTFLQQLSELKVLWLTQAERVCVQRVA
jgi:hypothetical protein